MLTFNNLMCNSRYIAVPIVECDPKLGIIWRNPCQVNSFAIDRVVATFGFRRRLLYHAAANDSICRLGIRIMIINLHVGLVFRTIAHTDHCIAEVVLRWRILSHVWVDVINPFNYGSSRSILTTQKFRVDRQAITDSHHEAQLLGKDTIIKEIFSGTRN